MKKYVFHSQKINPKLKEFHTSKKQIVIFALIAIITFIAILGIGLLIN